MAIRQSTDRSSRVNRGVFWAEEGFSTAGMVLALLITLSLIFTAARVYEINSQSAKVQDVADAAVLAAENVVGEFYVIAEVSDAIVLTMSLADLVVCGLGVVAACIPPTRALSESLFKAAHQIRDARDTFSERATQALDELQKALPFLANAKALSVLSANSSIDHASYHGLVILAPWQAEEVEQPTFEAGDEALDAGEQAQDDLAEAAAQAEEAARVANEAKLEGYRADCGNHPGYCLYERAERLSILQGSSNPYYASVDAWSFEVALDRAKRYYPARAAAESPTEAGVEAQADSVLRKRFYTYAASEISKGYVHETADSYDAYFPLLPKNTQEMKATPLYTETVYPITRNDDGTRSMHAYAACPGVTQNGQEGVGSIAQMEGDGSFTTCPHCEFRVSSMGNVAAASTNIENGFEHHYRKVAEAAEKYRQARAQLDPATREVKGLATPLLDGILAGLEEAAATRIEVDPPGKLGAVSLVVDLSSQSSSGHFPSSFVADVGSLGTRAAISSATLVEDSPEEGANVISSFLDGFADYTGVGPGPAQVVLDVWSGLLGAYSQGQSALLEGLESALNHLPFASESGLGLWARGALEETIGKLGLQPAELSSRKAVLVNSAHVLAADTSSFSAQFLNIKRFAVQVGSSGSVFGAALSSVESQALAQVEAWGGELELGTIEFFDGAVSIPVTITLPAFVTSAPKDLIQQGVAWLQGVAAEFASGRQWK